MNWKCTICDAVQSRRASERCNECGARPEFQEKTTEPIRSPRHARGLGQEVYRAWDFGPDGPVLRRIR